ncbi:MAG: hypothetical protein H7Y32_14555 [Chloroflexales bacterium]|nr:hypothetical protein [Chloroflexales bacterium]
MNQPSPGALPAVFLNRLVAVMNPHSALLDGTRLEAKLACGRWLALQRLRLGIPIAHAAERASLDVEKMTLLESGLADATLLPPITRRLLSNALAGRNRPYELVARAVDVAIEQWAALNDVLLDQIWADLDGNARPLTAAHSSAQQQEKTMSLAPTPVAVSPRGLVILQAVEKAQAPQHLVLIADALALAHKRFGDLTISLELEALLEQGLVEEAEPEGGRASMEHYTITEAGRKAVAAENLRIKQAQHAAERSRATDEQEDLPPPHLA